MPHAIEQNFLVKALQKVPVSSEWIGPPKGLMPLNDWLGTSGRAIGASQQFFSEFPTRLDVTPPRFLVPPPDNYKVPEPVYFPAPFVSKIPKGRVYSRYGAVITPDDYVIAESLGNVNPNRILNRWRLPGVKNHPGSLCVLGTDGLLNYYHWMTDILPRLYLMQRADIQADAYLASTSYPFQQETLSRFGIMPEQVIHMRRSIHIKADTVYLPSLPSPVEVITPLAYQCLTQLYAAEMAQGFQQPARKRFWISRQKSRYRHVVNEDEILGLLTPLGFECIHLENLSVSEQARLFASAEMIIAPHGAGLTNLVFCKPETIVIECLPPELPCIHFLLISSIAGLNYYPVFGDAFITHPPEWLGAIDIKIDPEKILKVLQCLAIS